MKRNIKLRFVLTDPDDHDFCEPVSGTYDLTVEGLRLLVATADKIDDLPEGYTLEIQAVRRKRPEPTAEDLVAVVANLNKSLDGLLAAVRT
jgi:hypothetical protein